MTRPPPPTLQTHHGFRAWTTRWSDASGQRRTQRFGREGVVSKQIATQRYERWLNSEWAKKEHVRDPSSAIAQFTVSQLAWRFYWWACHAYRKNGRPTSNCAEILQAMKRLRNAHGEEVANDFDAPKLTRLVEAMIESKDRHGETVVLSRRTVTGRLTIIKQAFAHARMQGWVGREVVADVQLVTPPRRGQTRAKEAQKVRPVAEDDLAAAKLQMSEVVRGIVDIQTLTGMRPNEVLLMRPCDIDTRGDVWLYTPSSHKTEHLDQTRIVPIGPKAQAIIRPFLEGRPVHAHLFDPRDAVTAMYVQRGATVIKPADGRTTSSRYTPASYRRAVERACDRANVHRWHPNQLRHNAGTNIRAEFGGGLSGLEQAGAVLGHTNVQTTEIYAERRLAKAVEAARKIG